MWLKVSYTESLAVQYAGEKLSLCLISAPITDKHEHTCTDADIRIYYTDLSNNLFEQTQSNQGIL